MSIEHTPGFKFSKQWSEDDVQKFEALIKKCEVKEFGNELQIKITFDFRLKLLRFFKRLRNFRVPFEYCLLPVKDEGEEHYGFSWKIHEYGHRETLWVFDSLGNILECTILLVSNNFTTSEVNLSVPVQSNQRENPTHH